MHRFLVALPSLLLLPACGDPAPTIAPPWTSPPAPATAEACSDCHTEQARAWPETGMARSLSPVTNEEVARLGGVGHEATGYRYDFVATEGGPGLVETRPGTKHERAAPLVLAVGSGRQDRSYVLQEGALLWFAPLEALAVEGGRLPQLSPPHAIRPGTRFEAPITGECLGCHTDNPPPRDYPLNVRPENWQPNGISCAACHGGAGAHVAHQEAELEGGGSGDADPIGHIADLSRTERMSICAACHLQGDARIVLEPGQLGPPAPGGDLLDKRALFVGAEPTDEVGFVSQVERLVLSSCYTKSDMDCATCHDPHHSLAEPGEAERVRNACFECHVEDGAEGHGCKRMSSPNDGDCVACHMPLRQVFDVENLAIHDHWIRREPGMPPAGAPLRFAESPTGDWRRFTWPDTPPPTHIDDPGLEMMAFHSQGHLARARERVDAPVHPTVAALPMYHHVRGVLLEGMARTEEAASAYQRALELDSAEAASATNLGRLLGATGQLAQGRALLDSVLEHYPRAEGAYRNRALISNEEGNVAGALADLSRAFQLHPTASLAETLAGVYEALGDRGRAREWRDRSKALTP